ncbi:hypothetical protein HK101_010962 [Irineochytrium annulatum]|nr:hypothetical protein HK101_010962 [Irineochytrium annulatum]
MPHHTTGARDWALAGTPDLHDPSASQLKAAKDIMRRGDPSGDGLVDNDGANAVPMPMTATQNHGQTVGRLKSVRLATIASKDSADLTEQAVLAAEGDASQDTAAPVVAVQDAGHDWDPGSAVAAPAYSYSFEDLMVPVRKPSMVKNPIEATIVKSVDVALLKRDLTITSTRGPVAGVGAGSRTSVGSSSAAPADRRQSKANTDDDDSLHKEKDVFLPRKGSTSADNVFASQMARSVRSQSSFGSDSKHAHPLIRLFTRKWDAFLGLKCVTLSVVMPGIWVYNFIQCFVILAGFLSAVAGRMLSRTVRLSIMASDLVAGRANVAELSAYWVNGRASPSHTVETVSFVLETFAEALLIACSILFKWVAVQTLILKGLCIPPVYFGETLPKGITFRSYLQGNNEPARLRATDDVFNHEPGPVYILQIMCADGVAAPSLNMAPATNLNSEILEEDAHSFLMNVVVTYPPGSVWNDITMEPEPTSYQQNCSVKTTVSTGTVTYVFIADLWKNLAPSSVNSIRATNGSYGVNLDNSILSTAGQANAAFLRTPDTFGAMPLIKAMMMDAVANKSYMPSEGGSPFANFMSEAEMASYYYHSDSTAKGLAFGLGSAAHFAVNLVNGSNTAACDYWGFADSGQLDIPIWAVIAASLGSGIVILWSMTTVKEDTAGYRRAIRALQHPFRFAVDASDLIAELRENEIEDDICDADLEDIVASFGRSRIHYGEEIATAEKPRGHLRIGKKGTICAVKEGRSYGSRMAPKNPELAILTKY